MRRNFVLDIPKLPDNRILMSFVVSTKPDPSLHSQHKKDYNKKFARLTQISSCPLKICLYYFLSFIISFESCWCLCYWKLTFFTKMKLLLNVTNIDLSKTSSDRNIYVFNGNQRIIRHLLFLTSISKHLNRNMFVFMMLIHVNYHLTASLIISTCINDYKIGR